MRRRTDRRRATPGPAGEIARLEAAVDNHIATVSRYRHRDRGAVGRAPLSACDRHRVGARSYR